jgi:hypothetical protein
VSLSTKTFEVLTFMRCNTKFKSPIDAAAMGENSNFLYFDSLQKKKENVSKIMHTSLYARRNEK